MRRRSRLALATSLTLALLAGPVLAGEIDADPDDGPCCTWEQEPFEEVGPIVWWGTDRYLTMDRLAAYCAPVMWFSPDEPLLGSTTGKSIRLPEPFPFEDAPDAPVSYYQFAQVLSLPDAESPPFQPDENQRGQSLLDLESVVGIDLNFYFYYNSEEGLNAHEHDVESVEMKVAVGRRPNCPECPYVIAVTRIVGKAHGVLWYDNTHDVDAETRFPIHVLVEEAKHASCPDKNGDGHYTPGFDVNKRVNDAWGIRDIIRSGGLFAANYQSWMTKNRTKETRVFPPLPEDSPRRAAHSRDGTYAPDNAIYELRPFPTAEKADAKLAPFITSKGDPDWPALDEATDTKKFASWIGDESFVKSWTVALRADGDLGISVGFPFFIVKHFEDPLAGGYIVNRVYLKDEGLRDFGYTALYTPSASRWIDPFFAVGFELDYEEDADGNEFRRDLFITETGIKFRVNMTHSPLKFLAKLGSDFWGVRLGIRQVGLWRFEELGYVVEFGAGSF